MCLPEDKSSRYHIFLKKTKEKLQQHIQEQLNEKWDQPDASGKGGTITQATL